MADFFSQIEWWRLEPAPALIINQATNWLQRMVLAKTAKGDLAVAYLPDNPVIRLNSQSFQSPLQIRWFNPQTGEQIAAKETIANPGEFSCDRPAGWEDALLVLCLPTVKK